MPCPMRFGPEPKNDDLGAIAGCDLAGRLPRSSSDTACRPRIRRHRYRPSYRSGSTPAARTSCGDRGPVAVCHRYASCSSLKPWRFARRQSARPMLARPTPARGERVLRRSPASGRGTTGRPWSPRRPRRPSFLGAARLRVPRCDSEYRWRTVRADSSIGTVVELGLLCQGHS